MRRDRDLKVDVQGESESQVNETTHGDEREKHTESFVAL